MINYDILISRRIVQVNVLFQKVLCNISLTNYLFADNKNTIEVSKYFFLLKCNYFQLPSYLEENHVVFVCINFDTAGIPGFMKPTDLLSLAKHIIYPDGRISNE